MSATVIVMSDTQLALAAAIRRVALALRSGRLLVLSVWLRDGAMYEQITT